MTVKTPRGTPEVSMEYFLDVPGYLPTAVGTYIDCHIRNKHEKPGVPGIGTPPTSGYVMSYLATRQLPL